MLTVNYKDYEYGHSDFYEMCRSWGKSDGNNYDYKEVVSLAASVLDNLIKYSFIEEVEDFKESFSKEDITFLSKIVENIFYFNHSWKQNIHGTNDFYIWASGEKKCNVTEVVEYINQKASEMIQIKRSETDPEKNPSYDARFLQFINTPLDKLVYKEGKYFYFKKSPEWENPEHNNLNPDFNDKGFEKAEWK